MRETELAAPLLQYLAGMGWDCFPEAKMWGSIGRADIAATRKGILWVIECKLSFSLSLLDQACEWLGCVNMVSILVPNNPSRRSRAAILFCQQNGIGIIERPLGSPDSGDLIEVRMPRFHKAPRVDRMISSLHPDMKRYTPGSQSGYSSAWRRTMQAAEEYVAAHPGCTIKQLADGIQHHYVNIISARGALSHWIEAKNLALIDRHQRPNRLYPIENRDSGYTCSRIEDA